jgi:hypothetical protein
MDELSAPAGSGRRSLNLAEHQPQRLRPPVRGKRVHCGPRVLKTPAFVPGVRHHQSAVQLDVRREPGQFRRTPSSASSWASDAYILNFQHYATVVRVTDRGEVFVRLHDA